MSASGARLGVELSRQPRIDITLSLSLPSNQTAGQNISERPGEADNISNSSSHQARPLDIIGSRILLTRDQVELEDNLGLMGGGGAQEEEEEVNTRQITQSELYKNIFMSFMSVNKEN